MEIREAHPDDLAQVAGVCDASGRTRWTAEMLTPQDDRIVVVAVVDGEIVGVAKTHFHSEPDGAAPAGYYLGGIVVAPDFRRRGVGSDLTRSRLEWIWSRSTRAYFFTDADNTASIGMHEALGFRFVDRFAAIRGVTPDDPASALVLFDCVRPG